MNRTEWQSMASVRLTEAEALLAAGFPDGAYYLAGYAAEFGLKACIMALVERTGALFRDKKFSERCMTHKLNDLVDVAGLKDELRTAQDADPVFAQYWQTAVGWSENARYERWSPAETTELITALNDPASGVLQWLKKYW